MTLRTRALIPALLAAAAFSTAAARSPEGPRATSLVPLSSDAPCNRCTGWLLPGAHEPSPHTVWRIDSDLPEIFLDTGVLYSTREVLPPFITNEGKAVPVEMRTQRSNGFETIDDSFEVFLYHLTKEQAPDETRRIVVWVTNTGDEAVTIRPRQAIFHGVNNARPTGSESALGKAVMAEEWDTPVDVVTLMPGEGDAIAWTKRLGAKEDSSDTTKARFVTGTIRADVEPAGMGEPSLQVDIVAIEGRDDRSTFGEQVAALMDKGAPSGEEWMDESIPPPQCHVRRVVGTAENVMWRSEPVVLDVSRLPEGEVFFPMALPKVQAEGCAYAVQTKDLALHPGYVHPDSIGNYMMEYVITMTLVNGSDRPRTADVRFGKTDQKIGLGHQTQTAPGPLTLDQLAALPVAIDWAGKGSEGVSEPAYDSSLLPEGPLVLQPGESRTVSTRMMVLGTSSLPWDLRVLSEPAAAAGEAEESTGG